MFDTTVPHALELLTCSSAAWTFWSAATLVVLVTLCVTVIVLLGPSWLRDARALFVEVQ